MRTLAGHSDDVRCVAISPDGKRIVSGSADNLVKIWNAETVPEVRFLYQWRGFSAAVALPRFLALCEYSWARLYKFWSRGCAFCISGGGYVPRLRCHDGCGAL